MKLVSMKVPKPKKDKDSTKEAVASLDYYEKYPWGLRFNLQKTEIEKLNAGKLEAGDKVRLVAEGKVIEKRVTDSAEPGRDNSATLEIQIQSMAFTNKSDFDGSFDEASK